LINNQYEGAARRGRHDRGGAVIAGLLTAEEAAARLGVKPASLYAYVSRGLLQRQRGPDGRSRFSLAELERVARRGRRDRAAGSEVRIESALTAIEDGAIFYRGEHVPTLALTRTFEEVAEFLWTGAFGEPRVWVSDPPALEAAGRVQAALGADTLPLDRVRVAVPVLGALDPIRHETGDAAVVVTGRRLLAGLADCLPRRPGGEARALLVRKGRPFSGSIAARLWSGLAGGDPPPGGLEALNAALVLVADHDLSVSTVAARMAASIAADPYAVASVGLSALGGAMQAVASLAAEDLLGEADVPERAASRIGERLRRGDRLPGFGHRLYPGGDPRAPVLLGLVRDCWSGPRLAVVEAVVEAATQRRLPAPNVDFALAALAHVAGMRRGASEAIFGLARAAGWLAHALEEYRRRSEIRPRAIYVGVPVGPER
jgi:citrate synthase